MSKSAVGVLSISPVEGSVVCCAPLAREPLSAQAAEQLSVVIKALAEPARLRLLSLVMAHEGGDACVCELTEPLDLSQPTVSHHLKVLTQAGLLAREKRGVWVHYRVIPETLAALSDVLTPRHVPEENDQ